LYGKPPVLDDLKVFESLCYATTNSQHRHKFDPRAHKCVFLGFQHRTKGYIVLNINNRLISVSTNVIFYENVFPYKSDQLRLVDSDDSIFGHDFSNTFFYHPTLMESSVPTLI
jgi:hypothetical protein